MNCRLAMKLFVTGAATLSLAACGGGGGSEVASTPPPPPTPATPPPPPPPIPPAHLGLVSDKAFGVVAVGTSYTRDPLGAPLKTLTDPQPVAVQFSYNASTNSYQIAVPDFEPGTLSPVGYNGSSGQPATSSVSRVTTGGSSSLQPLYVTLPVPGTTLSYSYTSFGSWFGQGGTVGDIGRSGIFAYGIPTSAGDVPVTGSATYAAQIWATAGLQQYAEVGGSASLSFDFAAGKLTGSMHPEIKDDFDGIFVDYGKYDFTQTVYSTGSTTFSGKFVVPGLPNADSSFSGMFTGPGAAELMANFQAPYLVNGQQGVLAGVWIGKKN